MGQSVSQSYCGSGKYSQSFDVLYSYIYLQLLFLSLVLYLPFWCQLALAVVSITANFSQPYQFLFEINFHLSVPLNKHKKIRKKSRSHYKDIVLGNVIILIFSSNGQEFWYWYNSYRTNHRGDLSGRKDGWMYGRWMYGKNRQTFYRL